MATGAVALQPERNCQRAKQEEAAREQEGSAARSIQQRSARRADPYRKPMTSAYYAKEENARILRHEDRHPKTWRHLAPNSSFGREQLRAESCSIVTARAAAFALPVWNGTDTPLAPNRSLSPPQRTHNDWRSRTRNRSPSRRPRSAFSLSSSISPSESRQKVVTHHRTPIRPMARLLKLFLGSQRSARSVRMEYFLVVQRRERDQWKPVGSVVVPHVWP